MGVYANSFIKIIMKQKLFVGVINVSLIFKNKGHFMKLYSAILTYSSNNWYLFINMYVLGFRKYKFCKMRRRIKLKLINKKYTKTKSHKIKRFKKDCNQRFAF